MIHPAGGWLAHAQGAGQALKYLGPVNALLGRAAEPDVTYGVSPAR